MEMHEPPGFPPKPPVRHRPTDHWQARARQSSLNRRRHGRHPGAGPGRRPGSPVREATGQGVSPRSKSLDVFLYGEHGGILSGSGLRMSCRCQWAGGRSTGPRRTTTLTDSCRRVSSARISLQKTGSRPLMPWGCSRSWAPTVPAPYRRSRPRCCSAATVTAGRGRAAGQCPYTSSNRSRSLNDLTLDHVIREGESWGMDAGDARATAVTVLESAAT